MERSGMSLGEIKRERMEAFTSIMLAIEANSMTLPSTMSEGFGKLREIAASNSLETSGTPFCRYESLNWDELTDKGMAASMLDLFSHNWKFELGLPAGCSGDAMGEVYCRAFDEQDVVSAVFTGAHVHIEQGFKDLYAWLHRQGLKGSDESFEFYLNDPSQVPPEEVQTKLVIPILR